ncbi:MAG: hypothetical protein JXJ17_09625 [Anaerolineae bacterium]|nr:hypothetical protein [Anaerolineae bacterium]
MSSLKYRYSLIFLVGLIAFLGSFALSAMLMASPFAVDLVSSAVRAFGIGLCAVGLTLWIVARRRAAGKTGGANFLTYLSFLGAVLLIVGVVYPLSDLGGLAGLVGVVLAILAFVVALFLLIFVPGARKTPSSRWPEGAEPMLTRFARSDEKPD